MKRSTQTLLYHLLPVVFWLLAIGGSLVPLLISAVSGQLSESDVANNHVLSGLDFHLPFSTFNYCKGYIVAAIVLLCIFIISRIRRHTDSVEECFLVAVLLGIASYWIPSVIFLTLPIIIWLYYHHLFELRGMVAIFIGYAFVAIWSAIFIWMGWLENPWALFFDPVNLWAWIPAGAILLAWIASAIARTTLRLR